MRRRPPTGVSRSAGPPSRPRRPLSTPKHMTERKIERRDPKAIREAALAKKLAKFGRGSGPASEPPPPGLACVTTQTRQSRTRIERPSLAQVPEERAAPPATVTQETRTTKVQKMVRKKNLLGVLHPDIAYLERGEQPPQRPSEPMPVIPENRRLPLDQYNAYKAWEAYKEYQYEVQMWKKNQKYEPPEIRYEKALEKGIKDAEKQFERDYRRGKYKGSQLADFMMGVKGAKPPKFASETEEQYKQFLLTQEPEPEPGPGTAPGALKTPMTKKKSKIVRKKDRNTGMTVRFNQRGDMHPDDRFAVDGVNPPQPPEVLPPHTPGGTFMDPRTFDFEASLAYFQLQDYYEHQDKIKAWEANKPYFPHQEWADHMKAVEKSVAQEAKRARTLAIAQARSGPASTRLSVPKHATPKKTFLRRGGGRLGTTLATPKKPAGKTKSPRRGTPENMQDVSGHRHPPPPQGGLEAYENWLREAGEARRAEVQKQREKQEIKRQERIMQARWGDRVKAVHTYDPDWPVCPPEDYDPNIDYDAGVEVEELGLFGPETPASVYTYSSPRLPTPSTVGTPPVPWVTPRMPWVTPPPDDATYTPHQPIPRIVSPWRSHASGRQRKLYRKRYIVKDDDAERRLSWGHSPSPICIPPPPEPEPEPEPEPPVELEPEECYIPWVTPEPAWYESPFEEDRFLKLGYRQPTPPRPPRPQFETTLEAEMELDDETRAALERERAWMQHLNKPQMPSVPIQRHPLYYEDRGPFVKRPIELAEFDPAVFDTPPPAQSTTPRRVIPFDYDVMRHPVFGIARGTMSPYLEEAAQYQAGEDLEEDWELEPESTPYSHRVRTPRYIRQMRQRMRAPESFERRPVRVKRFELSFSDPKLHDIPHWAPRKHRLARLVREHGVPESEYIFAIDERAVGGRRSPRVEEEEQLISISPPFDGCIVEGNDYERWLNEGAAILDETEEDEEVEEEEEGEAETDAFDWLKWDEAPERSTPVVFGPAGQELLDQMEYNRREYARLGLGEYGQELMRHMSAWGEPQSVCPPSPRF